MILVPKSINTQHIQAGMNFSTNLPHPQTKTTQPSHQYSNLAKHENFPDNVPIELHLANRQVIAVYFSQCQLIMHHHNIFTFNLNLRKIFWNNKNSVTGKLVFMRNLLSKEHMK